MQTAKIITSGLLILAGLSQVFGNDAVLKLQPVGYWPADEGSGETLHDRSGNANHGKIHHTPWRNGMLDFTSAFQWCQVPYSEVWQGDAVSIGGWLFTRERQYERKGMLFMGLANPIRLWIEPSVILRVRAGMELEVVSDERVDAIGSLAVKKTLSPGAWQHVLYTWSEGTGKLYLDGQLIQRAEDVPFELRKHPLIIGSDADWWMVHPRTTNSLNGSVRDLVLFNRALTADEVQQLQATTRPQKNPWAVDAPEFVIDRNGEGNDYLALTDFFNASMDARYDSMERMIWLRNRGRLEKTELLKSTLVKSLDDWQLRSLAAELLLVFGEPGRNLLKEKISVWMATLADKNVADEERAACALALVSMKGAAQVAVPTLIGALRQQLDADGLHPPRVENLLGNALMLALLELDPNNPEVSALSKQFLAESSQNGDNYFTQGDVNRDARGNIRDRAYTAMATSDGVTYALGAGRAWEGVEPISPDEFNERVDTIAKDYPEARNWRQPDFPHLYRVKISKTMPDGTKETSYLAGEDFIFDATDGKLRGWSVAVDKAGYLHIVGGQHNRPNPDNFIPGSWEKLGLSRDDKSESFPKQIYFVSKRPGDITEFEFVGTRNNPRNIPTSYLNYMNWVQDNAGELFLYGRINVSGWQSWGMFHYDVEARLWRPLGGDASDVIADARAAHPDWKNYLHHKIRGRTPTEPGETSVVWAWQPHFYNYCRDTWGIKFDPSNRMHLIMGIRGLDENGRIVDSQVYAWSDDLGKTFHRADGSKVELPLTVNPAPKHNADFKSTQQQIYWNLYQSLIRKVHGG